MAPAGASSKLHEQQTSINIPSKADLVTKCPWERKLASEYRRCCSQFKTGLARVASLLRLPSQLLLQPASTLQNTHIWHISHRRWRHDSNQVDHRLFMCVPPLTAIPPLLVCSTSTCSKSDAHFGSMRVLLKPMRSDSWKYKMHDAIYYSMNDFQAQCDLFCETRQRQKYIFPSINRRVRKFHV